MTISIGTLPVEVGQEALRELSARSQAVDLVSRPDGGAPIRCRVRCLHYTVQQLSVDCPTHRGQALPLRRDAEVELFFVWKGVRLSCATTVLGREYRQDLGGQSASTLSVLYLKTPTELVKAQRRSCYRVSLIKAPNTQAGIDIAEPDGAPVSIRTRIINLSETGVQVLCLLRDIRALRADQVRNITLQLPDDWGSIAVEARIVWIVHESDKCVARLGLEFCWIRRDPEHIRLQTQLARFIAEEQRQALLRQK